MEKMISKEEPERNQEEEDKDKVLVPVRWQRSVEIEEKLEEPAERPRKIPLRWFVS
jgi:hypothetical protein